MKKIVITFGLIAGAIVTVMLFITMPMYKNGTLKFDHGEIIGYTSMVIALSLIFFGVKSYRDNHLSGTIKFGKAFQVGMWIALVASLVYAIGWEIDFNFFIPDFMDQYAKIYIAKAKAQWSQSGRGPKNHRSDEYHPRDIQKSLLALWNDVDGNVAGRIINSPDKRSDTSEKRNITGLIFLMKIGCRPLP